MPILKAPRDFRERQLRMEQLLAEMAAYQARVDLIRASLRASLEMFTFSLMRDPASMAANLERELQMYRGAMEASWDKLPEILPCWETETRHLRQNKRHNDRERERQRAKRLAGVEAVAGAVGARAATPLASSPASNTSANTSASTSTSPSLESIEEALRADAARPPATPPAPAPATPWATDSTPLTDEEKMRALMDRGQAAPDKPIIPEF